VLASFVLERRARRGPKGADRWKSIVPPAAAAAAAAAASRAKDRR
jgi:hypothetical protein